MSVAGYEAIADVGETLVALLRDRMSGLLKPAEIGLASPGEMTAGSGLRLTVFLYRVDESAHLKNAERRRPPGDETTLKDPPVALDLHYLLTPHPTKRTSDARGRTAEEQHRVLGRAIQVLHDNSVLREADLRGDLTADRELRISMESTDAQSADRLVNLWGSFPETPYRPSVPYVVSPVFIESEQSATVAPVVEKEERYYRKGADDGR